MTDRSKSPRKRRLQLNAEDFAPPSDMYEASEEPRLDETWVNFYGGEKQGIKRLSDLDEETHTKITGDSTPNPRPPSVADITPPQPSGLQSISKPKTPEPVTLVSPAEAHPAERRPRPLLSSVAPAKEEQKPDAGEKQGDNIQRAATLVVRPTVESNDNIELDPGPATDHLPVAVDDKLPSFKEWSRRWTPWLKRGGSIKVCEAFFRLTHALGSAECFTSNSEIMKLTGLSRAQCIRNIHYLIEIGFLDELNEVNNREAKGTYYRFNLIPTSLATP
ncbi:MAG: helix-turn-helix domain-containing protein [Acidobacteria bacterium]|nr:helix-turn-helix domain-containing protein [Acidobacteriota bacterium]